MEMYRMSYSNHNGKVVGCAATFKEVRLACALTHWAKGSSQ